MRIVHVCKFFYPVVTGVTAYVHSLSSTLARRGHEVTVLTWGDADEQTLMNGFRVVRVDKGNRDGLAAALTALAGEHGVDVVNTHGIWEHVPVVSEWCRQHAAPHVVTMHGTWMFLHTTDAYATLKGKVWYGIVYRKFLWPRIMRRAAAAVVLNAQEQGLAEGWAVPEGKIHRIPNAVDTSLFVPVAQSAADTGTSPQLWPHFRAADGALRVMFVGALQRQKGVFTVLGAAKRLKASGVPVHWAVCGRGPDEQQLRAEIAANGLETCVTLAGAVAREHMPQAYRDADVVVLPSFGEPFGTVYLEAMASGIPCVGCRSGGTPEIIREGEAGYLIEYDDDQALADRIAKLAADADLRRRMGDAGRKRAEEFFAWDAVTTRLEGVYAQVIS
ncbi:glycosyltransferase family 4 protein [Desulfovibrio mangrovi]|uniref:glycosyltransferase family 4 protein n=1 Tax=Desulfovibrio mangrovi TaxID=2976983 RepID=UPI002245455F|nr:glycosyltransferase family 4 protein [Desulfovibrio mangrovi]UZP67559.1 glycosyltransferase family 4 protein [Desulfovibrio mangrovi]